MTAGRRHPNSPIAAKSRPEELTLTIEGIDEDGLGVAAHEGKPVTVFDALPGEKVVARVTHAGRYRLFATALRVLEPSRERVARNPCPHYRDCQSCALLGWRYAAQLAGKQKRVADALADYPSLSRVVPGGVWAAPEVLGYRASAKLVVARKRGRPLVGMYRRGSHDVVDIAACPLHHPLINRVAEAVRGELERRHISVYDADQRRGLLRYLLVRVSPSYGRAMVTLVTSERNYSEVTQLAKWLQRKVPEVASIHQNVNAGSGNVILGRETCKVLGTPDLIDKVGDVRLRLGPTSFLQVHHAQAARIYRLVRDWCDLRDGAPALDLYCGVGGISLHLAANARQVLGVESVAEAVRHARTNARMNGFGNCRFIAGDVEQILREELPLTARPGAVVVNPPRSGCSPQVVAAVAAMRPRTLVYVSCHPASLARDLDLLVAHGFLVDQVQPVDMFPQTPHVENVVRLVFGGIGQSSGTATPRRARTRRRP
jgi:23S rRNA (uracil1939-C5)-methyltransferase